MNYEHTNYEHTNYDTMIKKILSLLAIGILCAPLAIAQQKAEPMVAYRKNDIWHFYNSNNELMYNHNLVAPSMVGSYINGVARVRGPVGVSKTLEIKVGHTLIDEKGKFIDLKLPDSLDWRIINVFWLGKERVTEVTNNNNGTIAFVNGKNKLVPTTPLYYTKNIGEGMLVGYGKMPWRATEADLNIPDPNTTDVDYQLWSITNAAIITTIKAQEFGNSAKGLIPAKKGGKWGIINIKGQWVAPAKFAKMGQPTMSAGDASMEDLDISISEGAIPATEDGEKWGLINTQGQWLVKPEFKFMVCFSNSIWFAMNSEYNMKTFNIAGKPISLAPANLSTENKIAQISTYETYNNSPLISLSFVGTNGFYVYNTQTKKTIYDCKECTILFADENTIFVAQNDGNQLFVSATGKTTTLEKNSKTQYFLPFQHNIMAAVDFDTQLFGYINREGQWLIKPTIQTHNNESPQIVAPTFIYNFSGEAHEFYDHKGKLIRRDPVEDSADWDMMSPLYGEYWSAFD
jgi:hypothetical protein